MLAANLCVEKSDGAKATSYSMTVGSSNYMKCEPGSSMVYNLNIQRDNVYNIGIRYSSPATSHLRLFIDGNLIYKAELAATRTAVMVQPLKDVELPGGHHQLTVEVADGSPLIYEYNIKRGVLTPHVMSDDFDNGFSEEWGYREGNWNVIDGQLESTGGYGKMLMGGFDDIHLNDYTVECDVIYIGGGMNGGLLFRATNASTGGADDNPVLGSDFLQGYLFIAGTTSVALGKHNYGWQTLASADHNISASDPHHMKVVVTGATIRCYLDDMENPLITYTDPVPFITGRAGFRSHNSKIRFDNFVVTPADPDPSAVNQPVGSPAAASSARYYNLQGQEISSVEAGVNGIYIVRENGTTRKVAR